MENSEIEEFTRKAQKDFSNSNYEVVNKTEYKFYKTMSVLFFVLLLAIALFTAYMFYNNKLNGLIQSNVQNQINVNPNTTSINYNNYSFSPNIQDKQDNKYYNNYTIVNNNNITIVNPVNCTC